MTINSPFWIRVFVVDGDPDGLRVVEKSNWNGKALIFPRALFPEIKKRSELRQTGVYLLLGPQDTGEGEMLYVGEGDPIGPRLEKHHAEKDFWTHAVFFVSEASHINKAHVQYLEAELVQRARSAKRVVLANGNTPAEPTLHEADKAHMEVFLANMLSMLPVIGIHAFEMPTHSAPVSSSVPSDGLLTCVVKSKNVTARGRHTTQGFVVMAGSQAVLKEAPSMSKTHAGYYRLREGLVLVYGVLQKRDDHYVFTQDYSFESPSAAAAVVLGRGANGLTEWKDSAGRTLDELKKAEAAQPIAHQ